MDDTMQLSSTTAILLLHDLQFDRPTNPHEFVDLLAQVREAVIACPPDPDLALPYAEHVLYLWESAWPVLQDLDVPEAGEDGQMCECIVGAVFFVLSGLAHIGVLPGHPRVNLTLYTGSQFGKDILFTRENKIIAQGWTDALPLKHVKRILYNINLNWFTFTYGHHEVLQQIFPPLLTRLLELFEDESQDENTLWLCEAYLRRLWWPIVARGFFELRTLCQVQDFDEEMYAALLGATKAWTAGLMSAPNFTILAEFKIKVLQEWELPCSRTVLSRIMGTPPHVVSDEQIMGLMPLQVQMDRLQRLSGEETFQEIYNGPNDPIRQELIIMNVIENTEGQLTNRVKDQRHLWDKTTLGRLAKSTTPYILQLAGSYMTVAQGYMFISRTIEECLAQFLYLCPDDHVLRCNLLARGDEPDDDMSSAYLSHIHTTMKAVTL